MHLTGYLRLNILSIVIKHSQYREQYSVLGFGWIKQVLSVQDFKTFRVDHIGTNKHTQSYKCLLSTLWVVYIL